MSLTRTCLLTLLFAANFRPLAADLPIPQLHAVFFTPADVKEPKGVNERIGRAVAAAENLLLTQMESRGYPPAVDKLFERNEDGSVKILRVKGPAPRSSAKYQNAEFYPEIYEGAIKEYKLPRNRGIWWMFVYVGDPPTRFGTYRGAGDSWKGGWSICNYSTVKGTIDPTGSFADKFHEEFTLKGCVHELGHALGLPHLGPVGDGTSAPLMGPNIGVFERRLKRTVTDVHLSEAAAAMLWKHPLMTGSSEQRNVLPKPKWTNIETRFNESDQSITLSGRVSAELVAHSAVLIDEAPERDNYFRKHYVGRVDDGRFEVTITDVGSGDGTLHLAACFNNGTWTGTGESRGYDGMLKQSYKERRGRYIFAR